MLSELAIYDKEAFANLVKIAKEGKVVVKKVAKEETTTTTKKATPKKSVKEETK